MGLHLNMVFRITIMPNIIFSYLPLIYLWVNLINNTSEIFFFQTQYHSLILSVATNSHQILCIPHMYIIKCTLSKKYASISLLFKFSNSTSENFYFKPSTIFQNIYLQYYHIIFYESHIYITKYPLNKNPTPISLLFNLNNSTFEKFYFKTSTTFQYFLLQQYHIRYCGLTQLNCRK